jgi:hypothetical protein
VDDKKRPMAGDHGPDNKKGLRFPSLTKSPRPFQAPLSERQVQRAVFRHIAQRGVRGLVAFHTPNENTRNFGQGLKRGVSDIVLLHAGCFYALELKTGSRLPTTDQLAFIDAVNAAGGFACWCTGLDAALRILESWQLLRGRSS